MPISIYKSFIIHQLQLLERLLVTDLWILFFMAERRVFLVTLSLPNAKTFRVLGLVRSHFVAHDFDALESASKRLSFFRNCHIRGVKLAHDGRSDEAKDIFISVAQPQPMGSAKANRRDTADSARYSWLSAQSAQSAVKI